MNWTKSIAWARLAVLVDVLLVLAACGSSEPTGPGEVRWDRDVCARCAMVLSDQRFAVRVRSGEDRRRVYGFDDIGCAVVWLDQQSWKDDPETEIWVRDFKDSEWIDARTAWYTEGDLSPMGYNLSARTSQAPDALDFAGAVARIWDIEKRLRIHGSGHQHPDPNIEAN